MKLHLNPRTPWLLLYVFVNVVATLIMLDSGELIGDVTGNMVHSRTALIWAAILVVASYIIILGPVFNIISRIRVKPIEYGVDEQAVGAKIGKLLLFLQIAFMAFNVATGVNVAGGNSVTTDSAFSMVWVLIPVDALFVIYYGMYRESRYFYANAAVWLISNTLRGWAGVYFFILFFEWCRAVRSGKVTVGRAILAACATLLAYPIIVNLKWIFRASTGGDFVFLETASLIVETLSEDYMSFIADGVQHVIGRLQVTSLVTEVIRMSDLLQSEFAKGKFAPFWAEGLHGIIFERAFSLPKSYSVGVAFTQYGNFNWVVTAVGDWNTNIGYVGWFFIAPYWMPVYVGYTLLLCYLTFYLVKKIGISDSARDMVWLLWLVYILPPWFQAIITVIQALFLFLVIKLVFARSMRPSALVVADRPVEHTVA